MFLKNYFTLFLLGIALTGCSEQQARKPISQSTGTFMKESIKRNKKLVANEEDLIKKEIKKDTAHAYIASEELKPQTYYVDKENIMIGLRHGIKLMHKGDKVKFYFTSHLAYGYHGDNDKIGTNQPIICIVSLTDIKKDESQP